MGGLFGEADTRLPGLTTWNFYVICEKALLKQGFFFVGLFYTLQLINLSCPARTLTLSSAPTGLVPMRSGLCHYGAWDELLRPRLLGRELRPEFLLPPFLIGSALMLSSGS